MQPIQSINKSQRLFIELGTSLLLEPDDPDLAVSGELIGMQVGGYLIVRLPGEYPLDRDAREVSCLQVKYLCSGEIFGFSTDVMLKLEQPDRLLFLRYPQSVESHNIRSQERVECFLPVHIRHGTERFEAMIVNINYQGCLCIVDETPGFQPRQHNPVTFEFALADSAPLAIPGEIRAIRTSRGKISLGIRFGSLDNFAKTALQSLIPSLHA